VVNSRFWIVPQRLNVAILAQINAVTILAQAQVSCASVPSCTSRKLAIVDRLVLPHGLLKVQTRLALTQPFFGVGVWCSFVCWAPLGVLFAVIFKRSQIDHLSVCRQSRGG
jgi:hypothetical protein